MNTIENIQDVLDHEWKGLLDAIMRNVVLGWCDINETICINLDPIHNALLSEERQRLIDETIHDLTGYWPIWYLHPREERRMLGGPVEIFVHNLIEKLKAIKQGSKYAVPERDPRHEAGGGYVKDQCIYIDIGWPE